METFWQTLINFVLSAGIKIVISILLVVIGFKLIKMLLKALDKSKGFSMVDVGVRSFIRSFIGIALKVLLILTVAAYLGVPMTNMIAVLGSAGLAVGLALQGSLSNLAGGLMILIFKPFRVGDYIKSGADEGTVKGISILYTELITPDNCRIVVPNGAISNAVVCDYSAEPTRRVDLEFAVSKDSDVDQVKKLLLGLAKGHELILSDPATQVYLKGQANGAMLFVFRAWVNTADYWTVYFDMNEMAKKAFDSYGIQAPAAQVELRNGK